jgi:hypothetical protein
MELSEIIGGILMGIGIGFVVLGLYIWILFQRIKGRVDDMVNQIIQEAEDNMVGLEIEVDSGMYFCYNKKDKQFVCQGATASEVREGFRRRFPEKTAYIASGDPAVVEQFRTELSQLRTNENNSSI